MKRILLLAISVLLAFSMYSQHTIRITMKGFDSTKHEFPLLLGMGEILDTSFTDSVLEVNVKIGDPIYAMIILDKTIRPAWMLRTWVGEDSISSKSFVVDYTNRSIERLKLSLWDSLYYISDTTDLYLRKHPDYMYDEAKSWQFTDSIYSAHRLVAPNTYIDLRLLWMMSYRMPASELQASLDKMSPKMKAYPLYQDMVRKLKYSKIPKKGDDFISMDVFNIDGDKVKLQIDSGKITVLQFYSQGCKYCRSAMQTLPQYVNSLPQEKVEFVSISLDPSFAAWKESDIYSKISWRKAMVEFGFSDEFTLTYNVRSTPSYYIFDQHKKLITILEGDELRSLQDELKVLLNKL